ncbi:pyridoxal phosphate-dependent transferase [Lipomyces japonicus]|uniref:pyridoxal phosphate-dependent transferase n=1 Tax=Lipomyces japonicus TaxID=56871 RepID=UPI0034D0152B
MAPPHKITDVETDHETKPGRFSKDFSYHLSRESKLRQKSLLKEATSYLTADPELISLAAGLPSSQLFPIEKITAEVVIPKNAFHRTGIWDHDGLSGIGRISKGKTDIANGKSNYDLTRALQYEQGAGSSQVLTFVKEHMARIHNPKYLDWNCILTGGNTQGMETIFRMLLNPGDTLLLEEFAFPESVEGLRPLGLNLVGITVDDEGLSADILEDTLLNWDLKFPSKKRPHVLYTVPTGQNPTGATMALERRRRIYDICVKFDLLIVEDDPYYFLQLSEYVSGSDDVKVPITSEEFISSLVPSLLSIDVEGRVLRLDSLAKIIAPGLRMGWITGNEKLLERIVRHNEVGLQCTSGVSMAVIHGLFNDTWGQEGYLDWLVNLRADYTSRRNAIVGACEKYLPRDVCRWVLPQAGMFLWIQLDYTKHPDASKGIECVETEIFKRALANKVVILPGGWFKVNPEYSGAFFRATYAAASNQEMDSAIQCFAKTVRESFGL